MNKTIMLATLIAIIGFCAGRYVSPVKAASGASRVVHVELTGDWAPISGWGLGTVAGISCPKPNDCYVALQGN